MLLNLLMGYTALMILIAIGLFVHNLLELSAEEHAEPEKEFLGVWLPKIEESGEPQDKISEKERQLTLQELENIPFPIRAYCDRSTGQDVKIDKVISYLNARTRPVKK